MAKKPEPINYGGNEWKPVRLINKEVNAAIKAEQAKKRKAKAKKKRKGKSR